jgi:TonB family protein
MKLQQGLTPGAVMNLHRVARPDAEDDGLSSDRSPSNGATNSLSLETRNEVSKLAKTLAAVGGASISADLALDLVLNEVVEQARTATGASGAAIALQRDGEVTCRATTGNAPELGVRVEGRSGLSGACLQQGEIQICSDTETDPRVNAEACRRLNVHSILMIPIIDGSGPFGILEAFAAAPNSFGPADVKTLQLLAQRIADSKKASQEAMIAEPAPAVPEKTAEISQPQVELVPIVASNEPPAAVLASELAPGEPRRNYNEILTSVLVVLVITAAILLGLVLGVRLAIRRPLGRTAVRNSASSAKNTTPLEKAPTSQAPAASGTQSAARPAAPPAGGLIITEGGKVIYRSDPSKPEPPAAEEAPPRGLIHRVEPTYPESAKAQRLEGQVVLDAQVLGDGTVGNISIVRGHPLLAEAATEAVKQWKFEPSSLEGKPMNRLERITVNFKLPTT